MEIWKTIPNYSRYEASNLGNVRSLNYKNSGRTQLMSPGLSKDSRRKSQGYLKSIFVDDNGLYKNRKIHQMIALAFLGFPVKGYVVNHIDGNSLNNIVENLEYVTNSQNIQHAFDNRLCVGLSGSANPNSKLTQEDVDEIRAYRKLHGIYYGRKKLAEKYGVCEGTIKEIVAPRKKRRPVWPQKEKI